MKNDNIHDKYIKSILGEVKTAKSFLENYLPKEIIPLIDLNYLEIVKGTFIDIKLKEHFSDLIYKTKTKNDKEVFIYTLFEHKSYYDKFSVIQLLKYIGLCYDKYKSNNMPIVIPLLLYNGKEKWKSANNLNHLFNDIDDCFKKYIPNFNFEFYDFIREDKIIGNEELKLMINFFKCIFEPERLLNLKKLVNFKYINRDIVIISFNYLYNAGNKENKNKVIKIINENFKEEDIMSIAQALREEGLEKGLEKGREEGLEKGLEKGREEVVKNMLSKGLDITTISELTNLSIEKIEEIKNSLDK
jgi:predicted transposase/invertase (TIGR01784 family)